MIERDTIEIWVASTETGGKASARYPSILAPAERQRARQFRFDTDRQSYVLGKYMTRALLARHLGVLPEEIVFEVNRCGKPRIAGRLSRSELSFNLAHSGSKVVCAVGLGRALGVDIERERGDLINLARRHFCAAEVKNLEESSVFGRAMLFARYWTLKEAYLKAEGSGLNLELAVVDVSAIAPSSGPVFPTDQSSRGILLQSLQIISGFAVALGANGTKWRTEVHHWDHDSVIRRISF